MHLLYRVFSSPAALPIISLFAFLAVLFTYLSDRSKSREYRKSKILEMRRTYYETVLVKLEETIRRKNERVGLVLNSLYLAQSRKPFLELAPEWFKSEELTPRLSQDVASESLKELYASMINDLMALNLICNVVALSEPESSKQAKGNSEVEYTFGELILITDWVENIQGIMSLLTETQNLIFRQYFKEIRKLQPKDSIWHRVQDKIQLRKNAMTLARLKQSIKNKNPTNSVK